MGFRGRHSSSSIHDRIVSMGMEVVWIRQFTPYLGMLYMLSRRSSRHTCWLQSWGRGTTRRSRIPPARRQCFSMGVLALSAVIPLVAVDPFLVLGDQLNGLRLGSIVLFCAMAGFLTPLLVDSCLPAIPIEPELLMPSIFQARLSGLLLLVSGFSLG